MNSNGRKLNTVTGTDEVYGAYIELDVYAYALCETAPTGTSDHIITEAQAEQLFKYAAERNVCIANNSEAALYFSEWESSTVSCEYRDGAVKVSITDEENNSVYNEALTVKVNIPAWWSSAFSNGVSYEIMRSSDGSAYILIDIVPDTGDVMITNGN